MIILGFTGIGKTTLAKNDKDYIDLEGDITSADYLNYAYLLSDMGYNVFTRLDSYEDLSLIDKFREDNFTNYLLVLPHNDILNEWFDKLLVSGNTIRKNCLIDNSRNIFETIDFLNFCTDNYVYTKLITSIDYNLKEIIEDTFTFNLKGKSNSHEDFIWGMSFDGEISSLDSENIAEIIYNKQDGYYYLTLDVYKYDKVDKETTLRLLKVIKQELFTWYKDSDYNNEKYELVEFEDLSMGSAKTVGELVTKLCGYCIMLELDI